MNNRTNLGVLTAGSIVFLIAISVFLVINVSGLRRGVYEETRVDEDDFELDEALDDNGNVMEDYDHVDTSTNGSHFFYDDFSDGLYWWETTDASSNDRENVENEESWWYDIFSALTWGRDVENEESSLEGILFGDSGEMTLDADINIEGQVIDKIHFSVHANNDAKDLELSYRHNGDWNNAGGSVSDSGGDYETKTAEIDINDGDTITGFKISNEGDSDIIIKDVAITGGALTTKTYRFEEKPDEVTIRHDDLEGGKATYNAGEDY